MAHCRQPHLLVVAFVLRRRARDLAIVADLPGEVLYADGDILVSDKHGLVDKPDYILRIGEELIPVERKSRLLSSAGAYEGEILQLAAYCILVEEHYGKPVLRGQLQYHNRSVEIAFDEHLRDRRLLAIRAVQAADTLRECPALSHQPWSVPGLWLS